MTDQNFHFTIRCDNPYLQAGVVVAHGIKIGPSPASLVQQIEKECQQIIKDDVSPSDLIKQDIRNLLRHGGYKPAGRGKPASEYIANAARKNKFPIINNVVEIINLISLMSGLPASMLDLDKTSNQLTIRYGLPDEKYVFNQSGQEIKLHGLLCVCEDPGDGVGKPLGNPVKDSMLAKTSDTTNSIVGVVFSHKDVVTEEKLRLLMDQFQNLLQLHTGAEQTQVFLL